MTTAPLPPDAIAADPRLGAIADAQPFPLLFATVSGAHLYGFPSPDSDVDLRGVHVLPLPELVGLRRGPETIERMDDAHGLELDLVTHDVGKFVRLLGKPNGYVLEQVLSPLVVRTAPAHVELCTLARRCATRAHVRHYLGFARTQWRLFAGETPPRVKPLLYVYRVLRTGEVEANLVVLQRHDRWPGVDELIAQKRAGAEQGTLDAGAVEHHEREFQRLLAALEAAPATSPLPERLPPDVAAALHDFLVRTRLAAGASHGRD